MKSSTISLIFIHINTDLIIIIDIMTYMEAVVVTQVDFTPEPIIARGTAADRLPILQVTRALHHNTHNVTSQPRTQQGRPHATIQRGGLPDKPYNC